MSKEIEITILDTLKDTRQVFLREHLSKNNDCIQCNLENQLKEYKKRELGFHEQLQALEQKAKELQSLKSTFSRNITHSVVTPLHNILGFAELVLDPSYSEIEKVEFIYHIQNSGNDLLTMFNDIMDYWRLTSNTLQINKSTISLSSIINEIVEEYLPKANTKGLVFSVSMLSNIQGNSSNYNTSQCNCALKGNTVIQSDSFRLKQALGYLVNNAIKFTNSGKVQVIIQTNRTEVTFTVTDTGIGIAQDIHEKIFESFYRHETHPSRRYEGNGLGLSIAKGIIELMNGQISLESQEGKGSTFSFTIPTNNQTVKDPIN